jgi:hypothetical protein
LDVDGVVVEKLREIVVVEDEIESMRDGTKGFER